MTMLEAERKIKEYLQGCNGGGGDIQRILDDVAELAQADRLAYEVLRRPISKTCGIRASVLDAEVLPPLENREQGGAGLVFADPEPCNEPVDGTALLDEISAWLSRYVVLPDGAPDAIAAWVVATWFRDQLYFAPILAILSPTKRAGKTLLLDMLRHIVWRGQSTSGTGITPAVLFRLNDGWHPTFLVDEAEKLSGARDGAQEVIGLLNAGYRRGGMVQRCSGDDHHIEGYDAFGFRAVAAIGRLWDTLLDRSIAIRMQRKSSAESVERFRAREIEAEGMTLATRIARWAHDHQYDIADAEANAPRPEWLNDRACDNWSPLFAVGALADRRWLDRLVEAAGKLESGKEEHDYGEQLIFDVQAIFTEMNQPEVIPSGDLVSRLREIETSPWADLRGSGLSAHKLARMLKKFGIKPKLNRNASGSPTRGYWLADFNSIFSRYTPTQSVTTVTPLKYQSPTPNQSVTKEFASAPVSDCKQRDVTVVTVQTVTGAGKEEKNGEPGGVRCWSCRSLQGPGTESARCAMHKEGATTREVPF